MKANELKIRLGVILTTYHKKDDYTIDAAISALMKAIESYHTEQIKMPSEENAKNKCKEFTDQLSIEKIGSEQIYKERRDLYENGFSTCFNWLKSLSEQPEQGEKIPTVRIEFHSMPDLIMETAEYNRIGKWEGLLKEYSINPKDVKKVHHIMMSPKDYPTEAWEG